MRSLIFLFLFIPLSLVSGQNTLIDLSRIPQEKVRLLLEAHLAETNLLDSYSSQPTYHKGQDLRGYHQLESAYLLKELPDKVWKTYQTTSPTESWNGNMVSFGVLISKSARSVLYRDDTYFSGIDTGQVFYVNLKIMKGLYNLAVGLQIIEIDSVNRTITYSYIKGGKSRGEQTIYFVPTKKGYTEIIHRTAFKGSSLFRDYYLYPWFHRIAINEFHRNMKKSILGVNIRLCN
jgi:hypothetical protein